MSPDAELEELRRSLHADPENSSLVARLRGLLDRLYGPQPLCPRCGLSTHMSRGRVVTKQYATWVEIAQDPMARDLGYKDDLYLVGWRCIICNIVQLSTVKRRDLAFDWVEEGYG